MPVKKVMIALLLLLVYAMSFAHDFIPHCDSACANEHEVATLTTDHHHHHYDHEQEHRSEEERDHIEHKDHFDDGLIDFVACLLSDMEHSPGDCNGEVRALSVTGSTTSEFSEKAKLIAVLCVVCDLYESESSETATSLDFQKQYAAPPGSLIPCRGPPVLSC